MRNDIIIRSLQLSDAEQWRRLRLEALRSCPTAFSSSYDDAHRQDLSSFAAHIRPPEGPSILLGAFDGETLSGSVGLHVPANPKLAHRGEIWAVYVAPALRGTGVAAAMMRAAIAHARTCVSLLHLSVGTDNDAARKLYRTLGFVSYGIERRSIRVDGVDHDSDLLVLTLDA